MNGVLFDLFRRAGVALGVRKLALAAGRVAWPPHAPKIVQVSVNGCKLLVLANEDVGRRLAVLRRYEPWDSGLLSRAVREDDVCMDVGANTGYYTMLMAAAARRGAVHAFEPVKLNWHLLECGVLLNGFEHVTVNHAALADRDGSLEFSVAVDGAYSSIVPVGRKDEARRVTVAASRLDSYVEARRLPRVDVLKADVEGAEPLVLDGASGLLSNPARAPRVIMLELYDVNLQPYGSSVPRVIDRMRGYGYSPYWVSERGEPSPFGPAQHNVYQNVFFVRRAEDLCRTSG